MTIKQLETFAKRKNQAPLPDWFKDTILDSYEDNNMSAEQLENAGDIEDIVRFMQQNPTNGYSSPLHQLGYIWDLINAAQMVCTPPDLYSIPKIAQFKKDYPTLLYTFEVWAWG